MAKSTKNTYKPTKKGNLIPVVRMADGGNVSELNYSDRKAYIESHYAPFITDAQMIFSIYDSGIEYNYKGDRKEVVNSIIESYKSLADYTQITLPQETIYEIKDWELVRKDIDPDTDDVIGETPLKELSADNTYNFSYNGLVDLNWRVYEDEEYERYFYVITPHLGGDIRGNYGDAFILQGNDKDELFYRYYDGFISGGASIYFKFKDGSEIGFDSEQDGDVFYFRLNEIFEPTGMAKKYLKDFEKFETWYGDEFLEETIDIYLMRKGESPKMMAGGSLNDETPMAYIQVLGYNEGQWFNLTDYSDGQDVIDGIYDWMNGLNTQFGGNREEYEVTDYEGFGNDLYDQYMSSNEFDEIIEGYEKYENSDFHSDIITAYRNDSGSGSNSLSDVIDEMDNNFFGKYESLQDFGYEMVQQGVYEPSDYDVYITDTDKRILAGEEADAVVDGMDFDELLNIAEGVKSEYESEISDLENKISDITTEIDELTSLQDDIENADDEEYEIISDQIEEKEVELDDIQNELDNIDSRFEDRAREEARDTFYDEIYDKLENDLSSWLEEYGYTENLQDISFLSVDYEKIGDEIGADYLIIEYDGQMYFFSNYAKGGRLMATKQKPKYDYYIVESSTKKLVSGYSTKKEALEQRKLLIEEYPSMRFEIYTLGNLESKTDLDVFSKKDYVQLSTLDKIKKVSVDAFRYGKEKVGQANEFLVRNDVKGKIKRGARNVADKTKQGFNWLRNKWNEADFGDGKGKAKFFADGGSVDNLLEQEIINKIQYYPKGIPPMNHKYGVRYKGKTYSSNDTDNLVEKVLLETNKMADGGKLADWKEGKFINGKKWYLYKYDNKRWVLEIYKKDDLIDSYYIDVEELENQETGIGKKIYISYSNSQGSGILIPEMVQVKVFNVIKMDNPKLYFGENVYDYQVAHNKFSEEFGYSNGGGIDVVKKDRYGNEVKIGDAIHIRVLTGKYGQTKDYEGIVTNFDKFGNVELDGQRSVRYTADYKHNDYEHGHHIWVEKINAKDIKENLRVPKKFTPTFSSRDKVYGEDVIFTGTEIELKEFLKNKYPNSVWGQWNPLFNKGWRYNNGKYISPDKQEYDAFDFYQSVEQGQGYLNMLMIPKKYADGGGVSTPKYYLTLKKGLTITNELYQDTFKTGIQYSDWGITAEQYKKLKNGDTINIKGSNVSWDWQFKVTKDMVERIREIKTNDVEFANGGDAGNVLLQVGDVVVIYPNYASIYTNSKGEIVDIMPDNKTYEVKIKNTIGNEYVKFDKSELKFINGKGTFYNNGGGVENAEMPTRERTTITRPTTTPTTTPSKPDKDNPYKPKIKPRPKASKYNLN